MEEVSQVVIVAIGKKRHNELVMEVVSPTKAEHNRATKHVEYAKARIPDYWCVDGIAKEI